MQALITGLLVVGIVLALYYHYHRTGFYVNGLVLIDTEAKVTKFVNEVINVPTGADQPILYCDVEGINLCRDGSISIFTIYLLPSNTVYLIDVYSLKQRAFLTANDSGSTLRSILESKAVDKVFFDVRNDSDALFAHYGIRLSGIKDLQLMEVGARYGGSEVRKYVSSLTKCIIRHSKLSNDEKAQCEMVKMRGAKLYAPNQGGRYDVFNERPLRRELVEYCMMDVRVLPSLYERYDSELKHPNKRDWRKRVDQATLQRVKDSQGPEYEPNGPHKTLSPWQS